MKNSVIKILFIFLLFSITNSAFALGSCFPIETDEVIYAPTVAECNHKAGVFLSGNFYDSFSVVFRDCNNNDRDPCYKYLGASSCGSNYSSPFKAISKKTVRVSINGEGRYAQLYCFRESGKSDIFDEIVRRITVKLKNPVVSDNDLRRYCLPDRDMRSQKIRVRRVYATDDIAGTGYSAVCNSQQYLACETSYCSICEYAVGTPYCD